MEWLNENMWQVMIFLGLAILAIEVIVLGLATFVLFFVGVACLLTGVLMWVGILPQSMIFALGSVAVFSGVLAFALWKPMKNFQNKVELKDVTSDVVGQTFTLDTDVAPDHPGTQKFSGVSWQVKCSEALTGGTLVKVVRTAVGELTVERA
jgi:membrane protein implicated in regulation of membrane protease activity